MFLSCSTIARGTESLNNFVIKKVMVGKWQRDSGAARLNIRNNEHTQFTVKSSAGICHNSFECVIRTETKKGHRLDKPGVSEGFALNF